MISPMRSRPVILNNTPLVALWLLNRLDVLQSIYTTVYIPQAVLDEFLAVHQRQRQQSLAHSPWIQVASLHSAEYALAFPGLDQGEAVGEWLLPTACASRSRIECSRGTKRKGRNG